MGKIKEARANREISMMLPGNRANREIGERGSADGVRLAAGAGTTVMREDDGDSRGVGRSKTAVTSRPDGVARASSIVREG
jgi:hypothetical protein